MIILYETIDFILALEKECSHSYFQVNSLNNLGIALVIFHGFLKSTTSDFHYNFFYKTDIKNPFISKIKEI